MRSSLSLFLLPLCALALSGALSAYELPNGSYVLGNHPDGTFNPEGERLYGMVLSGFAGESRILFDFDHPQSRMLLTKTTKNPSIRIHGEAMGRVRVDGVWVEQDVWRIRFTYRDMISIRTDGGMNDLVVQEGGSNSGQLTNRTTGETYQLGEKANVQGVTFHLGDRSGNGIRLSGHVASLLADPEINLDFADGDEGNGGTDEDDEIVPPAGSGWVSVDEGGGNKGPDDFLFIIKSRVGGANASNM